MKKISVVIPMYCEEEVADICYKRVVSNLKKLSDRYSYEIIFINDGSKDDTLDILKKIANNDKNVRIISFSRNFGHQAAVIAGIRNVTGDAVIIMDADLQDPPELFEGMIEKWEDGYDVVYGKRKTRSGESLFKLLTAKAFYNTLNKLSEHNKFLRGLFSWVGFNQYAYEYNRVNRIAGKTKYPFKKMFKLATDGILSFSAKPLKVVGAIGFFSVIVSIAILVYSIVSFVFKLNSLTPGWTSIMCTMTFIGGIILISLGMIGEYIARIYEESLGRPEYIIDELINFKGEEYEEN